MKNIFLDSDVLLDVLANRKPFVRDSKSILQLGIDQKIGLYTSAICFSNTYYLLSKKLGISAAKKHMAKVKHLLTIIPTSDQAINKSLTSDFSDLEDAIQHFTALEANLDAIVTRNAKDFANSELPVFAPSDFLASLQ